MDEIGKGSHAVVYAGEFQDTPVAIKVYTNSEPQSLNAFLCEVESFYHKPSDNDSLPGQILQHPNITPIMGAYQDGEKSYIINELSKFWCVHQAITGSGPPNPLSQSQKLSVCI